MGFIKQLLLPSISVAWSSEKRWYYTLKWNSLKKKSMSDIFYYIASIPFNDLSQSLILQKRCFILCDISAYSPHRKEYISMGYTWKVQAGTEEIANSLNLHQRFFLSSCLWCICLLLIQPVLRIPSSMFVHFTGSPGGQIWTILQWSI